MRLFFAATDPNSQGFVSKELSNLPTTTDTTSTAKYLTLAYILLGSLALLMIVIAGLRYVLSGGNAEKMAEARRMIIYTVVGVIVAAIAASIVGLIVGRLS